MPYYDDPLAILRPGYIPQTGVLPGGASYPGAMPTQDGADIAAGGVTPFSESMAGRATGWLGQQYNRLAGPPTSHGAPLPVQPPAPPPAPPQAPEASQLPPPQAPQGPPQGVAALGMPSAPPDPPQAAPEEPLPVPPVPPQPALTPAMSAPQTGDGIANTQPPSGRYDRLLPGIFSGESGNDPNAKNPKSTASGVGQLLDGTWSDFVNSPANRRGWKMSDKSNPEAQKEAGVNLLSVNDGVIQKALGRPATDAELQTSWLLGGTGAAKLAANPNAPIETLVAPDAIKLNPGILRPGMTGAQAIASASGYYGKTGGAQVASSGAPAPADATPPPSVPNSNMVGYNTATESRLPLVGLPQGPGVGLGSDDIQQLLGSVRPTTSQQLQALASGFLSGPTFGRGLGKGLENLSGQNAQYQDLAMKVAQARATAAYHNGMLGMQGARLGQTISHQGNQDELGAARLGQTAGHQGNQDDVARQRLDAQTNGSLSPEAKVAASTNAKELTAFSAQEQSARENVRTISDLQAVLAKEGPNGLAGPDMASKVKRYLSTSLGVDVDGVSPSGISLAQKDLASLRNGQLLSQTRGSVPRSNAELQALQAGMGSLDQNPAALNVILQRDLAANQRIIRAGEAWRKMSPEDQKSSLGQNNGLFSMWRDRYAADQESVPSSEGATAQPRVQPGPGGTGWTHKDPASGLGFTIH